MISSSFKLNRFKLTSTAANWSEDSISPLRVDSRQLDRLVRLKGGPDFRLTKRNGLLPGVIHKLNIEPGHTWHTWHPDTRLENSESFSVSWLTSSRELPYLIAGNKNVPAEIPLTLTWPSRQRESHTKQTSLTARNFYKMFITSTSTSLD